MKAVFLSAVVVVVVVEVVDVIHVIVVVVAAVFDVVVTDVIQVCGIASSVIIRNSIELNWSFSSRVDYAVALE